MIYGIGTDIVHVPRIKASLDKYGDRFAKRILSEIEFTAFCHHANKPGFLAKRFAAKEATAKALGTGFRNGMSLRHVFVINDELGQPFLQFTSIAQEMMQDAGISASHLSLADDGDYALAYVILCSGE